MRVGKHFHTSHLQGDEQQTGGEFSSKLPLHEFTAIDLLGSIIRKWPEITVASQL
jgi:hypothetical protein